MNTFKLLTILLTALLAFSSCSKEEELIMEPCEKDNFGSVTISNFKDSDFDLHINGVSYGSIEKNITSTITHEAGNVTIELRGEIFSSNLYGSRNVFLKSCDRLDVAFY